MQDKNKIAILQDECLAKYSTFKIGGKARYFCIIEEVKQAKDALLFAKKKNIPYHVIGKGSNTLFKDEGFDGLAILNKIQFFEEKGTTYHVGAGYSFARLGTVTAKNYHAGLEFASCIPASVGGAVFMNAGAHGGEVKDRVVSVDFVDERGQLHLFSKEEIVWRYRYSSLQEKKGIIVGATFVLEKKSSAKQIQIQYTKKRMETQPLKASSIGCIFKNPEGYSAGQLIEKAGLKGAAIGDAEVSSVHANFIINKGAAKASDVVKLTKLIQATVKDKTGIELEVEARI